MSHSAQCDCSYLAGLASLAGRVVEIVQFRRNPWFLDSLDHAPNESPTAGHGDDGAAESPSPLVASEDSGDPRMQALRERALPQCESRTLRGTHRHASASQPIISLSPHCQQRL